jgi:hypothetical protein
MARDARPGERRGARQKGTPNKKTLAVAETLEALGCDPIEGMARIAMDESAELSIRAQMFFDAMRACNCPGCKTLVLRKGGDYCSRHLPAGQNHPCDERPSKQQPGPAFKLPAFLLKEITST